MPHPLCLSAYPPVNVYLHCVPCIIANASDKSKHGHNLLQLLQQSSRMCVCVCVRPCERFNNLRRVAAEDYEKERRARHTL